MSGRVAVFVDGENISAEYAAAIRKIASRYGVANVMRVYGNAAVRPKWDGQPGFRFIHTGTGKNATDILLTVQTMEVALSKDFATVVIASSDRDFTHLVTRIRELGVTVIGVGEGKAVEQFRAACSRFEVLALRDGGHASKSGSVGGVSDLDKQIKATIQINSKNGEGVLLNKLAPLMHRQYGVQISSRTEKTWRAYLGKRPELFELDPRGQDAKVRFKPAGFAAKD